MVVRKGKYRVPIQKKKRRSTQLKDVGCKRNAQGNHGKMRTLRAKQRRTNQEEIVRPCGENSTEE
jgi:hypothetical protein